MLTANVIVVSNDDIALAVADLDVSRGRDAWKITIEFRDNASERFDALATKLFAQDPRGSIAIIFDGKLLSAPTVQTEKFDGRAQITGAYTEEEARAVAGQLRSPPLPVPIGGRVKGTFVAGVPEAETVFKAE